MWMCLELQVSEDPEQGKESVMEHFGGHLEDQNAIGDEDKKE